MGAVCCSSHDGGEKKTHLSSFKNEEILPPKALDNSISF